MKTTATGNNEVRVWDPLVRIFHWSLVVSFAIAYLSGEESLDLHVWSGYAVLGLITFRLLWGFIGTRYARFSDFVYRPSVIITYFGDVVRGRAKRYLGHNPLGGAMIIALLVCLLGTTVSGLALYAAEENAGPLAGIVTSSGTVAPGTTAVPRKHDHERDHDDDGNGGENEGDEMLEEIHEVFSDFTLFLIVLHISGVIMSSRAHKENLVRAMITGRKKADPGL
jgi:cytochrome b